MSNGPVMADARLALIGAGALGCAVLPRLVRMPLASITIVDGDRVEERNLDRQDLYAPVDLGRSKAQVAAAWLRQAPIALDVHAVDAFLADGNASELISAHDIVLDLTDDAHARRLIDRICAACGVPLVSGAVHGAQGQVISLHLPGPGNALCLPDLFHGAIGPEQDGCDMRAVPLPVIEAVAARVVQCARGLIGGQPQRNAVVELFDGRLMRWTQFAPPEPART